MRDIFYKAITEELIQRIKSITPNSQPLWGKMSVDKMLAHCNVTYDLVFETTTSKAQGFKKWLLTKFVKSMVVNEKPYKKNGRTAPEFIITGERDFESEKSRLITFINKTQQLGRNHFQNKESHSFGKLTATEWNNLFYKHLDHHLQQFGV